jgi:hypothetical protein
VKKKVKYGWISFCEAYVSPWEVPYTIMSLVKFNGKLLEPNTYRTNEDKIPHLNQHLSNEVLDWPAEKLLG